MVRPHSGSPRSKQRPFSDGYHGEHHGGHLGPPSRSQRGFRGPPGKAPTSWRENSGGPHPYAKRPPLMGEPRERPHGHWTPHHPDHTRPYMSSQDSQRGRRRPSPPRSDRPPPSVQHRQSPHGPSYGPPGHHRPSFRGNHSGHVSPSARHFHGPPPPDRRGPSPHYRPPPRHLSPAHEQDRSWGPGRNPSPRERPYGRPARGGHRWNGSGGYPHPNGESRLSGFPMRKPREFHDRSSYQERWPAERDPRRQHGDVARERGRERPGHHGLQWANREGVTPHPSRPPYRSPSWKSGPPSESSSRFLPPFRPQERLPQRPLKRWNQEFGMDHGPPKRFRREPMQRPMMPLRGFGGRGLSLKDKSRLIKGRKFREESVARFKMPPPRPRLSDKEARSRVQKASSKEDDKESSGDAPQKKSAKRPTLRDTATDMDSRSPDPENEFERQVESRRSVRAHSSSPIDTQLTRDLVVVSHWEAGTRPSSSPKNRTSKRTDSSSSHGSLNEHAGGPSHDQKERRPAHGPGKLFKRPGLTQKPFFRSTLGLKRGPCPDGVFRKPLMGTLVPRPSLHQKSVFRKSQSIMYKYRNLQTLRHKAPPHPRQATSYRRW